MPNTLPPLPPSDDSWPPRDLRRLHPDTVEQLRLLLREFDAGAYDVETAVHHITRTVQRDGLRWAADCRRSDENGDRA